MMLRDWAVAVKDIFKADAARIKYEYDPKRRNRGESKAGSMVSDKIPVTISQLHNGVYQHDEHEHLRDRGMRRYHPFSYDFDSTPADLEQPQESWDEATKSAHLECRAHAIERLKETHGARNIESAIQNTRDLGSKGLSLISYHNVMYQQARHAFVGAAYYPALVGACALGERILNHLILDLRDNFKSSSFYKKVHGKKSFDDWRFAVAVLEDWKVLADGVGREFLNLAVLRNRSVHFNPETYNAMRDDALAALKSLGKIITKQFGYFGGQPWFIEKTPGAQFIKSSYEAVPFVRTYLIPVSGFVGPLYGMEFSADGHWRHLDYDDYGAASLSDDEFATALRERDPTKVVTREMIQRSAITGIQHDDR